MSFQENCYSAVTFSICNALISKILAIIFSSIKFGFYLATFVILKNWNKETKKLESICIFQFVYEIIILLTTVFMIIFSKYLNRKLIYRLLRIHTVIITIYFFFNCFIDMGIFASIKFKKFPDIYSLDEDPIFNYSDTKLSFSLENFIIKDTQEIDISLINEDIFNFTYLEKKNNHIYVPDPKYFLINFNNESKSDLMPYQKRHRFEFNIAMIFQLINTILDILSFFLWNSIRFKHKKLIQNSVIKKYGRKIMYAGYGRQFLIITIHDRFKEEMALEEMRNNDNYILETDIKLWPAILFELMELIAFYGALIVFIVLIILRNKGNYIKKALHFPFSLTFFGDTLYLYLLIFLIVNFGIDLIFVRHINILSNHHSNKDKTGMQCLGGVLLFTIGLVYLFFSVCGILGALFFIAGDIDSNGNLYIKTSCLDSDISCYGLFQFAPSFSFNNKKYSKIFYYIYIKKISNSDKAKNMAKLITILFIYFCQFYLILFERMFDFNWVSYGKCLVHDYVIDNNGNFDLLDNACVSLNSREEYYKNNLNDSYFNTLNNYKNQNNINTNKKVQISENSKDKNSTDLSGRKKLEPLNINIIKVSSNLRSNK